MVIVRLAYVPCEHGARIRKEGNDTVWRMVSSDRVMKEKACKKIINININHSANYLSSYYL